MTSAPAPSRRWPPTLLQLWWGWVLSVQLVGAVLVGLWLYRAAPSDRDGLKQENEMDQLKDQVTTSGEGEKSKVTKQETTESSGTTQTKVQPPPKNDKVRKTEHAKEQGTVLLALVRTSDMRWPMVPDLRDQLAKVLDTPSLQQWFLRDGVLVIGPARPAQLWDPRVQNQPPEGKSFSASDRLETVFGRVFDEVNTVRDNAVDPHFFVAVLWPNVQPVSRLKFNQMALNRPKDQPIRLFALDTPPQDLKPLKEFFDSDNVICIPATSLNSLAGMLLYHIPNAPKPDVIPHRGSPR